MNERIKEVREHFKMSQEAFGLRIGMTKSGLSKVERGENGTTDQTIMSICREFGVNEEWLRTGNGSMLDDSKPSILARLCEEKRLTQREQAVVSAFLNLSPQDRAAIMRYIDGIIDNLDEAQQPEPSKKTLATAST